MLTDTKIKNARPAAKPYRLKDGRGLYVLINPNGSKWWRLDYTVAGRRNTLSLGKPYPDTSLQLARERCDEARRLIAQGIDPSAQRKADKTASAEQADNSFEAVAREWLKVKAHDWVPAHLGKETLRLEKHAFPWIGVKPMSDLGVDDVLPLIRRVFESGHLEQAHRLREQISRVSRFAIATGRAKTDPAHALSEVLPSRQQGGFPAIVDPASIGELMRAIDGFKGTFPVHCALRLAPLLFCRPGELRKAEWSHFTLDGDAPEYRIPPQNRKLRKARKSARDAEPHIVPLSRQALAILHELRPLTGHRQYLFPGARDPRRCMSEAAINAALARLGFKGEMVGHGFRHMASTRLEELGFSDAAIEAQLSHKVAGVRGKYKRDQHLRALPERRRMMQAWAEYLDDLKQREGPVTSLRTA
ncbi:MAG: integrase arm-type DNA-binding domain-containing protein [Nevskiales bacterium]|nr:integrase arm-type DNA-binding domain-containing protein [Nevskiales bacterium]